MIPDKTRAATLWGCSGRPAIAVRSITPAVVGLSDGVKWRETDSRKGKYRPGPGWVVCSRVARSEPLPDVF